MGLLSQNGLYNTAGEVGWDEDRMRKNAPVIYFITICNSDRSKLVRSEEAVPASFPSRIVHFRRDLRAREGQASIHYMTSGINSCGRRETQLAVLKKP